MAVKMKWKKIFKKKVRQFTGSRKLEKCGKRGVSAEAESPEGFGLDRTLNFKAEFNQYNNNKLTYEMMMRFDLISYI